MSGITNFTEFNPTNANQDTDAVYATDAFRTGGAVNGAVCPSSAFNKLERQASLMTAALALMLADKGYSPVDGTTPFQAAPSPSASLTALAGVLANIITAADQSEGVSYSIAAKGYIVLPTWLGGLIIQWTFGATDPADGSQPSQSIPWPNTFPNACLFGIVSMNLSTLTGTQDNWYQTAGWSAGAISVQRQNNGSGQFGGATTTPYVIGIGY
jgi:hypothetical protein